jgi:hypothetical protein
VRYPGRLWPQIELRVSSFLCAVSGRARQRTTTRQWNNHDGRGDFITLLSVAAAWPLSTYAQAGRVRRIALLFLGIGTIAIMPNDADAYPEDSFDNMKAFAVQHGFTFAYVIDTTQEVARAYDAQCTPDFFGFNAQDELQYRGRLDASRMTPVSNARRDLFLPSSRFDANLFH